jgi:hypothetical protein
MSEQLSDSQTDDFANDYEAEWADGITEETQPTSEAGSAPELEAQDVEQITSQDEITSKAAEPESDDIYAGLSEKHIEAIRQAERNEKANLGRYRIAKDKADRLERELQEERNRSKELEVKARQPSQFEQDHPDYYEELKADLKNEIGTQQVVPSVDTGEAAVESILTAHPDAGDVYNSNDFKAWIGAQPKYVRNTIESSDPEDVISVLDSYKSTQISIATSRPSSSQQALEQVAHVGGSPARPNLSRPSDMSASQQYDAEWAIDD